MPDFGDGRSSADPSRILLLGYQVALDCGGSGATPDGNATAGSWMVGAGVEAVALDAEWHGDKFALRVGGDVLLWCRKGAALAATVPPAP